jgi:hypothetical protein
MQWDSFKGEMHIEMINLMAPTASVAVYLNSKTDFKK